MLIGIAALVRLDVVLSGGLEQANQAQLPEIWTSEEGGWRNGFVRRQHRLLQRIAPLRYLERGGMSFWLT
jgi:hypothetical protein